MENQQNGFDDNESCASFMSQVDSTMATLQFKIGTVQGTLLHGFYFMAVILFRNTILKNLGVISLITQPGEEVPVSIKNVLHTRLQVLDFKEEPVQMLKDEKDNPPKTNGSCCTFSC